MSRTIELAEGITANVKTTAPECCPTCKRPLNLSVPRRFCADCKQQITRYHKWQIGKDGRIRHRICDRPECYK